MTGDDWAAARLNLFYSGLESNLRNQFWLLDVEGFAVPGLEKIDSRVFTPYRYYHLYRFTPAISDSAVVSGALLQQLIEIARRNPGDRCVQSQVGETLVRMGRPAEAIPPLTASAGLDPRNLRVLGWRARAHFELGDYEAAARDGERAVSDARAPAESHRLLGMIRLAQGRTLSDARLHWRGAIEREPSNPDLLVELAVIEQALGDSGAARSAFDRGAKLSPEKATKWKALAQSPALTSSSWVLARIRTGER